jgi:hypothetical protein
MRGADEQRGAMFSYVSAEEGVPADHPLRAIRPFDDESLRKMTRESTRSVRSTAVRPFRRGPCSGSN